MNKLIKTLSLAGRTIQNKLANLLFGFSNEQLDYVYDAQYIDAIKSDVEDLSKQIGDFDPDDYDFDALRDYDFNDFVDYEKCQEIASDVASEMLDERDAQNSDIVEEKLTSLELRIKELENNLVKKPKSKKKNK